MSTASSTAAPKPWPWRSWPCIAAIRSLSPVSPPWEVWVVAWVWAVGWAWAVEWAWAEWAAATVGWVAEWATVAWGAAMEAWVAEWATVAAWGTAAPMAAPRAWDTTLIR